MNLKHNSTPLKKLLIKNKTKPIIPTINKIKTLLIITLIMWHHLRRTLNS